MALYHDSFIHSATAQTILSIPSTPNLTIDWSASTAHQNTCLTHSHTLFRSQDNNHQNILINQLITDNAHCSIHFMSSNVLYNVFFIKKNNQLQTGHVCSRIYLIIDTNISAKADTIIDIDKSVFFISLPDLSQNSFHASANSCIHAFITSQNCDI